jgi:hypothetical protein
MDPTLQSNLSCTLFRSCQYHHRQLQQLMWQLEEWRLLLPRDNNGRLNLTLLATLFVHAMHCSSISVHIL